jgi:flagellar motility protein MotE (MotC chaperone)
MGSKMMPIVIGVVVIIGAVIGLGVAGIVPIPGLTHAKKKGPSAKAKKEEEAKAAQAKADADKATKLAAADALQKAVAQRDQLVKGAKWAEALPLAQQAVAALTQDKPGSPELTSANDVVAKIQAEIDKAALPKPDPEKGFVKLAAVWGEMKPDKIVEILRTYKPEDAAPILKRMDEDKVAAVFAAMLDASKAPSASAVGTTAKPGDVAAYSEALAKEVSKPPVAAAKT